MHKQHIGLLLYALAMLSTSLMDAALKLVADELPIQQIVFFRAGFAFLPVGIFTWVAVSNDGVNILRPKRPGLQVLRGLCGGGALATFIIALNHSELSAAVGVSLVAPLIMIQLGVWVLKEVVSISVIAVSVLGLGGAFFIIQPQTDINLIGGAFAVISAFLHACAAVLGRFLARKDHAATTSFCTNLVVFVFAVIFLIISEIAPMSTAQLLICGFIGLVGGLSYILIAWAVHFIDISSVASIEYTSYAWAILFGMVLFAETPAGLQIIGVLLIVISGLYSMRLKNSTK